MWSSSTRSERPAYLRRGAAGQVRQATRRVRRPDALRRLASRRGRSPPGVGRPHSDREPLLPGAGPTTCAAWSDSGRPATTRSPRRPGIPRSCATTSCRSRGTGDGKIDHLAVPEWVTALGGAKPAHRVHPCEDVRLPRGASGTPTSRSSAGRTCGRRLLPTVPPRYRGIVATAADTESRWGEAACLCADALDLNCGRLRVIRTVVEVDGRRSRRSARARRAGARSRCRSYRHAHWRLPLRAPAFQRRGRATAPPSP